MRDQPTIIPVTENDVRSWSNSSRCMDVCIYVCIHVCMLHVFMYACMHVCLCMLLYIYIYIHTQTLNRFSMSLRLQWWDDFPHISTRLCTTASALGNHWIMGDPNLRTGNCTGCGRSPIFKKYPYIYIYIYMIYCMYIYIYIYIYTYI